MELVMNFMWTRQKNVRKRYSNLWVLYDDEYISGYRIYTCIGCRW